MSYYLRDLRHLWRIIHVSTENRGGSLRLFLGRRARWVERLSCTGSRASLPELPALATGVSPMALGTWKTLHLTDGIAYGTGWRIDQTQCDRPRRSPELCAPNKPRSRRGGRCAGEAQGLGSPVADSMGTRCTTRTGIRRPSQGERLCGHGNRGSWY